MYKPSFLYCRYAIRQLRRFQDLVRHDKRWAGDIDLAEPIEKLLPKNTPKDKQHMAIDSQISRRLLLVKEILRNANVNTRIVQSYKKYDPELHRVVKDKNSMEEYDLLAHYFEITGSHDAYEILMQDIEQGIGLYEDRQRGALLDIINPGVWIVWFIRLPLWLLFRAGIEDKKLIEGILGRVLQAVMILLVLVLSTKIGVSIPWDAIAKVFYNSK